MNKYFTGEYMNKYQKLGEFAGQHITGVAGSFMLTEEQGNYMLDKVVSERDTQTLTIIHTDDYHETTWKVMYVKESVKERV